MNQKGKNQKLVMIECQSLTKIFKGVDSNINQVVLKTVNLEIPKYTLTAIVGPSGSGKTTLLNVLASLIQFEGGKVIVDGIILNDLRKREKNTFWKKKITLINQFPEENLFMNLSVSDNLKLSNSQYFGSSDINKAIKRSLDSVNLSGYENNLTRHLSGGELQRLMIAVAIIRETPIILADEPTGELDSLNTANIFELFRSLSEKKILTSIVVSHDTTILEYCDLAFSLSAGEILLLK